jgi:hypothetical protein
MAENIKRKVPIQWIQTIKDDGTYEFNPDPNVYSTQKNVPSTSKIDFQNILINGTDPTNPLSSSYATSASFATTASFFPTNPVIFVQGSVYTNIQATMTLIPGIIGDENKDQFNQYKIQGIGTFTGTQVYADLICIVAGSTNSKVYNNVSTVVAEYPGNGPVSSPMGGGTLIEDFTNGVLSVATICTILDDNTIGAADEHHYIIVLDTNATDGRCVIHIDFTILVPIADTVTFTN